MNEPLENESEVITRAFAAPPPPQPEPPEIVVLPTVSTRKPGWDFRLYAYIRNMLTMMVVRGIWRVAGHLAVKVVRWLFDQSWRAYQLAKWRLSKRVTRKVFAKRQQTCDSCEALVRVGTKRYCGACNCGQWKWADLLIKNEREEHRCPFGLHDGSYRTSGGCSSCGGSPQSNGKPSAPQARR